MYCHLQDVCALVFYLVPVSRVTIYTFAVVSGLLWSAPFPVTIFMLEKFYGSMFLGTLSATAEMSCQVFKIPGSFLHFLDIP